jgi:hypothetical protein
VKFGTLSVPMWQELQTMPVWRAKLGIACELLARNGSAHTSAPAASLVALLVLLSHFMMLLPAGSKGLG